MRHGGKDRQECLSYLLPVELGADLPDTGSRGAAHQAESAAADVAARVVELRVVEDVEEFSANLESHGFGDSGSLRHPEIGIDDSGAMEETPAGIAKGAENGVLLEGARQEVPVPAIGVQVSRI